jgi:flagellar protein FliS
MYQAARVAGGAGQHYRTIDLTSKIEGASPHRLITILYDELITALAAAKMAIVRQDPARLNENQARASSIVQTLDASLDFDKGGEVARALSAVYREIGR